jgi:hypothetical protein
MSTPAIPLTKITPAVAEAPSTHTLPPWIVADLAKSGITPARAADLGWHPVTAVQAEAILGFRLPPGTSDGYAIPYHDPTTKAPMATLDGRPFVRIRFREPVFTDVDSGKTTGKYLSPKDGGIAPFVLPEVTAGLVADPAAPLLLSEGEKKVVAATDRGLPMVGLGGIWMWMAGKGLSALEQTLAAYATRRRVVLVYDSDATDTSKRANFELCARRLAAALLPLESTLEVVVLPALAAGGKTGVDDFLLHPDGGVDRLRAMAIAAHALITPERPEIILPGGPVDVIHAAAALAEIVTPHRRIFVRADSAVQLRDDGMVRFQELRPVQAVSEFELYADLKRWHNPDRDDAKLVSANLGEQTAKAILAAGEFTRRLPKIKEILDYPMPVPLPDRTIGTARRGYDPRMLTYVPHSAPHLDHFETHTAALLALGEILEGFCFGESPSPNTKSLFQLNAISYLLTAHCRALFAPERAPVFYFEANRQGAGKDYLAGLAMLLTTGSDPNFYPPVEDSDEMRKRIFAVCLSGERFFIVSNAKGVFADPVYEAAATSPIYSDRRLGVSENRGLPNGAIYALSGNDLTLSEDMSRRIVRIRLEFYGESVEARTFSHPDLYGHVRRHRARYLGALQAMVNRWVAAGCPEGSRLKPSFVRWSQIIGGIFEACELPNPIGEDVLTTVPCKDVAEFRRLLDAWQDVHGAAALDSRGIRELAVEHELFGYLGDLANDRGVQTRFGRLMGRYEKRSFGGRRIVKASEGKRPTWAIEEVEHGTD